MSKNSTKLESFVKFCENHPNQRFWQALRNWSGHEYILVAEGASALKRLMSKLSGSQSQNWQNTEDTYCLDNDEI